MIGMFGTYTLLNEHDYLIYQIHAWKITQSLHHAWAKKVENTNNSSFDYDMH